MKARLLICPFLRSAVPGEPQSVLVGRNVLGEPRVSVGPSCCLALIFRADRGSVTGLQDGADCERLCSGSTSSWALRQQRPTNSRGQAVFAAQNSHFPGLKRLFASRTRLFPWRKRLSPAWTRFCPSRKRLPPPGKRRCRRAIWTVSRPKSSFLAKLRPQSLACGRLPAGNYQNRPNLFGTHEPRKIGFLVPAFTGRT